MYRDDFNSGHVDVFFGTGIGECAGAEMEDDGGIMVLKQPFLQTTFESPPGKKC